MRDCQYCKTRNLERDEPHIYGCPGLTIERLRDQRTVLCEQLTDKCDELKAASVEIEQAHSIIEGLKGALDFVADEVPTNWLDPLLSGPEAIKVDNSGQGVEKLLRAIKRRIRNYAEKALKESLPTKGSGPLHTGAPHDQTHAPKDQTGSSIGKKYLPHIFSVHPQRDKHMHHPGGNPNYCLCGSRRDDAIHQSLPEKD